MNMNNKLENKPAIGVVNKARNKIQIALPKLCNYDDDNEDEDEDEKEAASMVISKPAVKISKPATGLLSLLPQPKANQFMNSSKTSTTSTTLGTTSSSGFLLPRTLQPNVQKPNSVLDEDDLIRQRNFKRFKNEDQNSVIVGRNLAPKKFIADYKDFESQDPEIRFNDEEDDNVDNREHDHVHEHEEYESELNTHAHAHAQEQTAKKAPPELNQEALMKLCGKKNSKETIELMNVKANDIMGDTKSNLMKQITKEYKPPSNRDYFGSGSKRKHQITYLAYVLFFFYIQKRKCLQLI